MDGYKFRRSVRGKASFVGNKPHDQSLSSQKSSIVGNLDQNAPHESKPNMALATDSQDLTAMTKKLENPLSGIEKKELISLAEEFAVNNGFSNETETFIKGALLAQRPNNFMDIDELSEEDKAGIQYEIDHKWHQPWQLYKLAIMSGMAAVVQGMDETVVAGAQIFYLKKFGIRDDPMLTGLVNGAPYLCCAVLGCWLTEPMNRYFGRRGTIWISCFIAAVASIWEAFTYSWVQLFVARFVLGLGIGPKSATVPVYSAETAPARIRGALVMQWQVWTAFGIMLGNIVSAIFLSLHEDLAWRVILGSTVVAPTFVCLMVYTCPESPRWYIKKGKINKAYKSLLKLRRTRLQAARDCFYMTYSIKAEEESQKGRNLLKDFIKVPRVRRAAYASEIVMFMQQFCGINVIAYYSSTIFVEAGFSEKDGILAAMGTGIANWIGAIPALVTIDTFGRRNLLLVTFPLMALCLLFTGLCFLIPNEGSTRNAHIGLIALGIYLFELVYSPGEGPVPFTYSAEVYPLYVRELGMSLATATTWLFNFILALTWPKLLKAFGSTGAFCYYAGWNVVGFFLVYFFLRESKGYTLEELDRVFAVPTKDFVMYQVKAIPYHFKTKLLRRRLSPLPPLYDGGDQFGQEITSQERHDEDIAIASGRELSEKKINQTAV